MSDNFIGFIKSLLLGVFYALVLFGIFYLIVGNSFIFKEFFLFVLPVSIGAGLMMGFAVWGAETGIGRVGLTLYLASFIVPFLYGIISYFIMKDAAYLWIPGLLSAMFVMYYIQLGLGEFNYPILIIGAITFFVFLIIFAAIGRAAELASGIVSIILGVASLITVAVLRAIHGSVLDI